jgi:DNA mismatch repair protein MutS
VTEAPDDAAAGEPVAPPRPTDDPLAHHTPMMRQYLSVKAAHPHALILFRMGDFFETFYDDAKAVAQLLDLTLTARAKEKDPIPMAGVPHHAIDGYVARLVALGKSVVLVDQTEDPRKAKGLVRREVTRILTPGTFVDPHVDERRPAYLAALALTDGKRPRLGLALLDVGAGELRATEADTIDAIVEELARVEAREVVFDARLAGDPRIERLAAEAPRLVRTPVALDGFGAAAREALLERVLGADEARATKSVLSPEARDAVTLALTFAERTQLAEASHERKAGGSLGHVGEVRPYVLGGALVLDREARTHLELFRATYDGGRVGSLVGAIDEAVTPLGGRLLVRWLDRPLLDVDAIRARQDVVRAFLAAPSALDRVRVALRGVHDLERLLGRVVMGRSTPRDLGALRASLQRVPDVLAALGEAADALRPDAPELFADDAAPRGLLGALLEVDRLADVRARLEATLVDDPSTELGTGRVFATGVDPELDRLVELAEDGRQVLARIEVRERERTGIGSLKVRHNRVFGYYIEITKANLASVPKDYIRKQTTAGGERFYTEELKTYEEQIEQATELRLGRETELFQALVLEVAREARRIRRLADAIGAVDVLAGLAAVAERQRWSCPEVDAEDRIEIEEGRHPVLEALAASLGEPFVPNDVALGRLAGGDDARLLIVTGPNMAGKSTIMRQTALIVILAQLGSFVPARRARIGVVDRVFTRVGASDDLSRGRSTFMVEMAETARILRAATARSLILLDEIGRGTSTFDGLSIAWAVAEHLHDVVGAKTLFATHYHELTEVCREKVRARNVHVAVREQKDEVVFLRKLVPGPTNRSYGVQVARIAGLPKVVVARARKILERLEAQDLRAGGLGARSPQLGLFEARAVEPGAAPDDAPDDPMPDDDARDAAREASVGARTSSPRPEAPRPEARPDPRVADVVAALRAASPDDLTPRQALDLVARLRARLLEGT